MAEEGGVELLRADAPDSSSDDPVQHADDSPALTVMLAAFCRLLGPEAPSEEHARGAASILFRRGAKTAGMLRKMRTQGRLESALAAVRARLQLPADSDLMEEVEHQLDLLRSDPASSADVQLEEREGAPDPAATAPGATSTRSAEPLVHVPGECLRKQCAHAKSVTALAATDTHFFSASSDGSVLAWSRESAEVVAVLATTGPGALAPRSARRSAASARGARPKP